MSALIEQLDLLRSIIFPAAYNPHAEYFPGLGCCRACGKRFQPEDIDIYIPTQKRVLELHEQRL
jgi:hypothetical protein